MQAFGGDQDSPAVCPSCNASGTAVEVRGGYLVCHREGRVTGRVADGQITALAEEDVQTIAFEVAAPAGWYIDPENEGQQRYWSGSVWSGDPRTDMVSAKPFPGTRSVALAEAVGKTDPGRGLVISTADSLYGHSIEAEIGPVMGTIVNSRGPFSDSAARMRTAVGGEVRSYGKLMEESRTEALVRLRNAAVAAGADAVICMRFETTAITDEMVDVLAYGTAVRIRRNDQPSSDDASSPTSR